MESSLTLIDIVRENRIVYIYGPPGIGKSHSMKSIKCIDFPHSVLRSKQPTLDFLERAKYSRFRLLLDDFDSVSDLIGVKEINEDNFRGVIIGNAPWTLPLHVYQYEFPVMDAGDIMRTLNVSKEVALKSGGDLRFVEYGFSEKDVYWTPKKFVTDLICEGGKAIPSDFIGDTLMDHGHIMDLIHDNYIDGTCDMCDITESLSIASMYDTKMYQGDWYLMPYFSHLSCIYPSIKLNHSVPCPLRPGSYWTKYSNTCMRKKKIKEFMNKNHTMNMDMLYVIRDYLQTDMCKDILKEYKFERKDIDMINYICINKKFKPKFISDIKKLL
jgi:hypothetical protein